MPNGHPDGPTPTITLRFPPWVHIAAFVLIVSLGGLAFFASSLFPPIISILAVVMAFYTAFYARKAIQSARTIKQISETVNFSRIYSTSPILEIRAEAIQRFDTIYSTIQRNTEAEKLLAANEEFSLQLRTALENRSSEHIHENPELLTNATCLIDYFEDLAVGIQAGLFDEETAKAALRQPLIQMWGMFSRFVEYFRAQRDTKSIYEHTEALYERWR